MGLLDQATLSLCLFDIYRGVFAHTKNQVQSSSVKSDVHAAAKINLFGYLLEQTCQLGEEADNSMKAFLGDLVTGIHL